MHSDGAHATRLRGLAPVAALVAVLVTGCGSTPTTSDIMADGGWPGAHSDARNSDTSTLSGARELTQAWSRPLTGTAQAGASITAGGQAFVTAQTPAGCNLFSFEMRSARMRFCNRLLAGPNRAEPAPATPIVDTDTNTYIGTRDGTFRSYNEYGQERWLMPVFGTPLAAQFTGDGNVLSVTQFGEVNVFDRQIGRRLVSPLRLLDQPDFLSQANLPWPPNDKGLDDCATGRPGCAVANTPAVDLQSGRFYLTLWRPNTPSASLVALTYADGKITRDWTVDVLTGGSTTSPVLSSDRSTVYVGDNAGHLLAVATDTGQTRWSHDLGGNPRDLSVSADGLIIPYSRRDAHLRAIRDKGDHAEVAWERNDLTQTGPSTQTAGGTGYTVVRGDDDHPTLLTFDTDNGTTLRQDALPDADGPAVGVAIGPKREVVITTALGTVHTFTPTK